MNFLKYYYCNFSSHIKQALHQCMISFHYCSSINYCYYKLVEMVITIKLIIKAMSEQLLIFIVLIDIKANREVIFIFDRLCLI